MDKEDLIAFEALTAHIAEEAARLGEQARRSGDLAKQFQQQDEERHDT